MTTFTYKPEDANPIVPEGIYDAVVLTAKCGTTKAGDSKIEVCLKVYDPDGVKPLVTDHVTAPYGIRRLKQLCQATGVNFDSGKVHPLEFVGKNVRVKLRINHDDSGEYEDRNAVATYLPDDGGSTPNDEEAAKSPAPTDESTQSSHTPEPTTPLQSGASATAGKREAWQGYRDEIRRDRPDVSAEELLAGFQDACKALLGDKSESEYTEADWSKVRDEGPIIFIPF